MLIIYNMVKKFSDLQSRAWISFIQTQQLLLEKVDEEFKKKNLPPLTWYDVMLELDKQKDGMLRLNVLGERILLSKYNVTRIVRRLEEEGLVYRETCPQDARGVYAVITPKGRELRKRMWPVYYNVIRKYFFSSLTDSELEQIVECMNRIRKGVEKNSG